MAKIILGKAPQHFKRIIDIELLDGSKADIEITYKYRTRADYAKLLDGIMASEAPKKGKKVEEVTETASEIFTRLGDGTADFILDIASGWNLEDKFDKASITQLINEYPAVTNAISETYRIAILEGRKGN